jgi:hypothetical protein
MNPMDDEMNDERLSRLYREAAREEPAMKLDSAILSQARKAVEKNRPWWRINWIAPLATVGVAMLTVSLVIQMNQQHPQAVAPASVEEAAPVPQSAPKRAEMVQDKPRQEGSLKALKMKPAAPEPMMDMAPAENEIQAAPSRAAAGAAKKQEMMGRSQLMERDANKEAAAGVVAPAAVQAATETEPLPPEQWIEKIRALLEQGKKDEAAKEIEAFRATLPDYKLPADLKVIGQ